MADKLEYSIEVCYLILKVFMKMNADLQVGMEEKAGLEGGAP